MILIRIINSTLIIHPKFTDYFVFCIGRSFSMVKAESKKTFTFGKKKRRIQQLLAAQATLLARTSQAGYHLHLQPIHLLFWTLLCYISPHLSHLQHRHSTLTMCALHQREICYNFEPIHNHKENCLLCTIVDLEMLQPLFLDSCPQFKVLQTLS